MAKAKKVKDQEKNVGRSLVDQLADRLPDHLQQEHEQMKQEKKKAKEFAKKVQLRKSGFNIDTYLEKNPYYRSAKDVK